MGLSASDSLVGHGQLLLERLDRLVDELPHDSEETPA